MPDTTSKTGTGANFTDDGRPIDHSLVSLSEYQNARGQPQTDYEGLVYDAAGGSRIMTPAGERYYSPYAAQPTKEELSWLMSQPTTGGLTEWQKQRPGYVDPMDYKTYEDYAGAANIRDNGDITNRANFYGMSIENYQNALSGDPTRPMGGNQAVYGAQLLSPLEQRAAETARGQGISTMSPETLALARANPDVFNAASQRFQNYLATTYPGTLEYESVLSGPMQFSNTGVKYPEIKDTVNMYILDPRTKQYVKNPNYRGVKKAADGGLMGMADHMASKGRGPDSMLIHMSPREVQGLQTLAMNHGGSLTINPHTGLPEAGFLDKLLPAIIGVGLSMAGVPPNVAAMLVGGAQTIRTGDIGKGISAGLGAYGGAGLGAGMSAAGASSIGGQGAGLAGDMAFNLADAGSSFSNALPGGETGILNSSALSDETVKGIQQQAANRVAETSPFDKISKGFDAVKANPMGYANADNFKYMAAAAAPILADQAVKSNLPTTTTKPGMIRPYSYDPYGGTYTAGTPYEAQVKKAASGGIMGFDESANSPMSRQSLSNMQDSGGMFNYAHDGGGVMKMAEGGLGSIARYANGGDAALEAYQRGDYKTANDLLGAAGMSAQDVVSKYGLSQADAATVAKNLGYAGDMSGIQYAAPPVAQAAAAAPTYTQYTPEQIGSYLSNPANKDIDLQAAIKATNADPYAVNQYIAKIDDPFRDATLDTRGSGTFGIFNNMITQGIDPNELRASNIALDPKYATQGWSADKIANAYNLTKGSNELSAAKQGKTTDTDWAKLMVGNGTWDKPQYSVNDMAQVSGLSINEVNARYELEKLKAKAAVVTPPPVVTPIKPIIYNTAGTNPPTPIESVLGLPPGVGGAGITTVNPNGTITTRPDIPGIPEGGFTGMTDVRDAYTKGGGSLGYIPYAPKTMDEFNARYNKLTGGSKQAYDYLMGKTPYSATPYTPTGEIMKPYWESVGKIPAQENNRNKKYVFVNGKYELNPGYVKPSYILAGEKAAVLSNKDTKPTTDPGAGNDWIWNSSTSKWEATPIGSSGNASSESSSGTGGQAEGGLAALTMARGGTTHMPFFSKSTGKFTSRGPQVYADGGMAAGGQFDLGGYSDGGRLLRGPGDGVSDSIPATIGDKRPARLADGEFVVPARIVSELGNGSTEAGARKLYAMMDRVQAARKGSIGKGKVAKNSRADKYLPV